MKIKKCNDCAHANISDGCCTAYPVYVEITCMTTACIFMKKISELEDRVDRLEKKRRI